MLALKPNKPSSQSNRLLKSTDNSGRVPFAQYYKSKVSKLPDRISQKTAVRSPSAFLNIILLLAFIFAISYSLLIKSVAIDANSKLGIIRPQNIYTDQLQQAISGLKYKNKLTFSCSSLQSELISKFPEIISIGCNIPWLGQKSSVNIKTSGPILRLNANNELFAIDNRGIAITKGQADIEKIKSELIDVTDQSGFQVELGKSVLSSSEIKFISYISDQLKSKNISISQIILTAEPEGLRLKTIDRTYYTKFYLLADVKTQLGTFIATRAMLDKDGGIQPVEYIDVRVEGKVFIK